MTDTIRRFSSIAQVRELNRATGHHFFDRDTLRFFGSRILPTIYGGRYFITAERTGFEHDAPHAYTVRQANADGTIDTVGDFLAYPTPAEAVKAVRGIVREAKEIDAVIDPADLVNVTEAARRLGIDRTALNGWTRTRSFPPVQGDPAATGGRLYLWPAVEAWALQHRGDAMQLDSASRVS